MKMAKYAYFDPADGRVLQWIDTGAMACNLPADELLLELTAEQWEQVNDQPWWVVSGTLMNQPRPSAAHEWVNGTWVEDPDRKVAMLAELNAALCKAVDEAADDARRAVAGDPLRAVEYDRAASEAQTFAAAGYQGAVPPMVAAWAINGRTAQQAADDILREAAQYNDALVQLRATRLQAKELIRQAMADGDSARAEDIAAETIAAIEAAIHGVGNAGR